MAHRKRRKSHKCKSSRKLLIGLAFWAICIMIVLLVYFENKGVGGSVPLEDLDCVLSKCDCNCYLEGLRPEDTSMAVCDKDCQALYGVSECVKRRADECMPLQEG